MRSTAVALTCLAAFLLAGCESLPKVSDPSGVEVSVTGLTDSQVMTTYGQGAPFDPDPYIAPFLLLSGSQDAYVVLRVDVASVRKAYLTIQDALATDSGGNVVARGSSKREFLDLLRRQGTDEQLLNQLGIKVERTYLPDGGVEIGPGRRSFVVVLVGKEPLASPLAVSARLSLDLGTPRTFQLQWSR